MLPLIAVFTRQFLSYVTNSRKLMIDSFMINYFVIEILKNNGILTLVMESRHS
jgi:hypothetical protein